jgi:hypothetical protein
MHFSVFLSLNTLHFPFLHQVEAAVALAPIIRLRTCNILVFGRH